MVSNSMRALGRALLALAALAGMAAEAAVVVSVTIEGPSEINAAATRQIQYQARIAYDDGSSVIEPVSWFAESPSSIQVARFIANSTAVLYVLSPGITTLHAVHGQGGYYGGGPRASKIVAVTAGTPTQASIDRDCAAAEPGIVTNHTLGDFPFGHLADAQILCGTQLLLADRSFNRLEVLDVSNGTVLRAWQLTAAPLRMRIMKRSRYFFVPLAASSVARIDPTTNEVSYIALPGQAEAIVEGHRGEVWVGVANAWRRYDPKTLAFLGAMSAFTSVAEYDPLHASLFTTGARYEFDPLLNRLTSSQSVGGEESLALSPDGRHIVVARGGGNGVGYNMVDYNARDLATFHGVFNTGPYPRDASFRFDGRKLLATDGWDHIIFDVATHVSELRWAQQGLYCPYHSVRQVRWSPQGRNFAGLVECDPFRNEWKVVFGSIPAQAGVVVMKAGEGSGTVTSNTGGIQCGVECAISVAPGTVVTLTATAEPGSTFLGWSGCPSASGGQCTLTASGLTQVTAIFAQPTTVTMEVPPAGSALGQSVAMVARVSAGSAQANAGTVTFRATSTTGPVLCSGVPVLAGAATCNTTALAGGGNSVIAMYSGSATLLPANSPLYVVVVSSFVASPSSMQFGPQSVGTASAPQALTLTNASALPIAVSGVTPPNDFRVQGSCGTVAAGAACTLDIVFAPQLAGDLNTSVTKVGALTVFTDRSALPDIVQLAGTAEGSLVTHYYRSILRREPDSSGNAYWSSESARMVANGANVNEVWFAMATSFFASTEYATSGRSDAGFVTDLYRTFLSREPDAAGIAYWVAELSGGLPREGVMAGFMFSPEFGAFTRNIFGTPSTRAEVDVVVDFYRGLLGRLPDSAGMAHWVQRFRSAQCSTQPAAEVTLQADGISMAFLSGSEYVARNRSNAQLVADLYNAFMRRGADREGMVHWIGRLAAGTPREEVRRSFVASPEFRARVQAMVAQGC